MKSKCKAAFLFIGATANTAVSIFLSVLGAGCVAYAQQALPKVEIPGTELRSITSKIVAQEYDLYIHLPRGYSNSNKAYPVLYLLDAQWDFPLATAIYGQQFYDGFLPSALIVGITWGGKNPNHDSLRARDLTPTNVSTLRQSGGAPQFLSFIKEELIPFIEARYRVTNDRTLMGSSFGGLFTLYTLFTRPELFQRYVLTSPALGWDNEVISNNFEKSYAERASRPSSRLFMAVGELEDVAGFQKFVDHLQAQKYEAVTLQSRVLENTGHSGTKAEGYTRGLQAVFARPSLLLAPEILEKYVGDYKIDPQLKISITQENGALVARGPGNAKLVLQAENEKDFYLPGRYFFIHFKKNEAGKVTGFQLEQFSGESFAPKMNFFE